MKYLLDTHTFIWNFEADPNLPVHLRAIIDDPSNEIYVSIATLWEMTIKVCLGKLTLTKSLTVIFQHMTDIGFVVLPINTQHLLNLEKLPFYHRDPFDRLLIAQSITENMQIISIDQIFDQYLDCRIW